MHHTEEDDDEGTNGRDSIFRSRQSSKRWKYIFCF